MFKMWRKNIHINSNLPSAEYVYKKKGEKTMSQSQPYFLNATLFNYQLIQLSRYEISPIPKELQANRNITVKIRDGNNEKTFSGCHIDNTKNRRLRLPLEAMMWIKKEFPFSAAYFMNEGAEAIWKKEDIKNFFKTIQNKKQLDTPAETLLLSWETGGQPCLYLQAGFKITEQNAAKVLSVKAMSTVLPYIFSSVQNTSYKASKTDSKKCYIIDYTTPWLSASDYYGTAFAHPGIYLLRRKEQGQYFYYVGKATDIKNRIVTDKKAVFHPQEKGEKNKQYDDICCISINMDAIKSLYGTLDDAKRTPNNNPGVVGGSEVDNALYAVEDLVIHTISMILKSEGKKLDNVQYRTYTNEVL